MVFVLFLFHKLILYVFNLFINRLIIKMFRPNVHESKQNVNTVIDTESINDEIVMDIEKELQESPLDLISLVFLLYDIPDTALQKLIVFQRISKDSVSTNLNLLHDWLRDAKRRKTNWKHEFLEALLICQLYGIVKKMRFHIPSVMRHYQPDDIQITMYVNPMKKALYKICENMNFEDFTRLQKTLFSLDIDVKECDSFELIFLKLMSQKIITCTQNDSDKKYKFNADKLIQIIDKFPNMKNYAIELKELQSKFKEPEACIPQASSSAVSDQCSNKTQNETQVMNFKELTDAFNMFMDIDDDINFEGDNNKQRKDKYIIKNPNKVGTCIIINQENFHLSDISIKDNNLKTVLDKRTGSTVDKQMLEHTMSSLNFKVITADDLDHKEMMNFIKINVNRHVHSSDSIFMLCILSHGVRGHVYAADCVKVNVDNLQNLLDSEEVLILRGLPKLLIIQACQVDNYPITMVPDSPNSNDYLKKSDFLIYWATAPEYEAYRNVDRGSVFIQILCAAIYKYSKKEHLYDIFTVVNKGVITFCKKNPKYKQVPIFASTLTRKIYLQNPE